jgi:3-hydroxyacyl-[acyl-carrier-protein] dehydratase
VRGSYAIPPGIKSFPPSLIAESVGQLAAWASMSALNFERRPVAGLAGGIELLGTVRPGQTLELSADLETVDQDAVAYGGMARADGVPVIRLENCVGPMAPEAEFDDPDALRARFTLLCSTGAAPGAFAGVPSIALERTGGEAGQSAQATLQVPAAAEFFGDHFPRKPVFPGTLLMDKNLELAAALAAEVAPPISGGRWAIKSVSDVKLRAFIPPGQALEIETKLKERTDDSATLSVHTRMEKKLVGSAWVRLTSERK